MGWVSVPSPSQCTHHCPHTDMMPRSGESRDPIRYCGCTTSFYQNHWQTSRLMSADIKVDEWRHQGWWVQTSRLMSADIKVDECRHQGWWVQTSRLMSADIKDAGNFRFRHLSSHSLLFVHFTFRPFSITSQRTKKNDKEVSRPLSEPPFFLVPLAGRIHRSPSPILHLAPAR